MVTEGNKEAPSHEEALVLLEKRKEIPPPEELSSRAGHAPKNRKKTKAKSKAKTAEPTPEVPIIVEDENKDEVFSESVEAIYDDVPLQRSMPGVKIKDVSATPSAPVFEEPSPSNRKGKRVLEEEANTTLVEVYLDFFLN